MLASCGDTSSETNIPTVDKEEVKDPKITLYVKHPKSCTIKNATCNFIEPIDVTNSKLGDVLSKISVPNDGDITLDCLGYNLKTDMPNSIPIGFTIYKQLSSSNSGEWAPITKELTTYSTFKDLCMKKRQLQKKQIEKNNNDIEPPDGAYKLPPVSIGKI